MAGALVARRMRVEGRVQGVYYRASAAELAARLGVRGHAHNLPDGAVEVLAVGPPESVEALQRWLWQGPPLARVTAVQVEPLEPAAYAGLSEFRSR